MKLLEIGPGREVLEGFETLNIVPPATYIGDAKNPPIKDNTFDLVYSSHCIEHMQWYDVEDTIKNWARIVKPGGMLEVFTVNGLALMKTLIALERTGKWTGPKVGPWKDDLIKYDPYKWAVGRLLNYPKKGPAGQSYLHRSIITPKYLHKCFDQVGLVDLVDLKNEEARGKKHGWINFGLRGTKPLVVET